MTSLRDAFAAAFDAAPVASDKGGKKVHIHCEFKVKEYRRGEGSGKTSKKSIEEEDTLAATGADEALESTCDIPSQDEAIALDREPVKTPASECKAKNPMRCRYHGAAAMTTWVNNAMASYGITPLSAVRVVRNDESDDGSYTLDFDVNDSDLSQAKKLLDEFASLDGIEMGRRMSDASDLDELDATKFKAEYEIDELDPDDEFIDEDEEDEEDDADEEDDEKYETPTVDIVKGWAEQWAGTNKNVKDVLGGTPEERIAACTKAAEDVELGKLYFAKDKFGSHISNTESIIILAKTAKKYMPSKEKATTESLKDAFEKALTDTSTTAPTHSDTSKSDADTSKSDDKKPIKKKVDAVGLLLEASKAATSAAKTINRQIDKGAFDPHTGRIDHAESFRVPLTAMAHDSRIPDMFRDRASSLVDTLDKIAASKAGGWKTRIPSVSFLDEAAFRKEWEEKMKSASGSSEKKSDEILSSYEPIKTVAEGKAREAEMRETADYISGLLGDKATTISPSLRAELEADVSWHRGEADVIADETKALARKEDEEKAAKEKEEADRKAAEEKRAAGEGEAPKKPRKPRAKKTTTDTKLDLGSKTVLDGDTGIDINKRRASEGKEPLEALKHIDRKVKNRTENYRMQTKALADSLGDPELDISDPEVFATVQKNWAETLKRIANEGQFCSFCEPNDLIAFISDGHYKTKLGHGCMANLSHAYGIARKDESEAAISSILCPKDSDRKFSTKCADRFGPLCIEWKKDGNLVPCFSACDADEPANQDRTRSAEEQVWNTTLFSNPSICSLPIFCKGDPSIIKECGFKSPTGAPETSWQNAIKLLRKGPIKGDAKDFDEAVNGGSKWKPGLQLFGWNESPLLGHGTTGDVAAIHFNSKKFSEMKGSAWSHGTDAYSDATECINSIVKRCGAALKDKGIKIILDGKEFAF